ncbi:hypothetical protein [Mesorhizobium sp. M0965]
MGISKVTDEIQVASLVLPDTVVMISGSIEPAVCLLKLEVAIDLDKM